MPMSTSGLCLSVLPWLVAQCLPMVSVLHPYQRPVWWPVSVGLLVVCILSAGAGSVEVLPWLVGLLVVLLSACGRSASIPAACAVVWWCLLVVLLVVVRFCRGWLLNVYQRPVSDGGRAGGLCRFCW